MRTDAPMFLLISAGLGAGLFVLPAVFGDMDAARKELALQEEREHIEHRGATPELKAKIERERDERQARIAELRDRETELDAKRKDLRKSLAETVQAYKRDEEKLRSTFDEERKRLEKAKSDGKKDEVEVLAKKVAASEAAVKSLWKEFEENCARSRRAEEELNGLMWKITEQISEEAHQRHLSQMFGLRNATESRLKEILEEIRSMRVGFLAPMAVRAISRPWWSLSIAAGFIGLWGVICWGAGTMQDAQPDPMAARGTAIIGGVVGVFVGGIAGGIGALVATRLPTALALPVYGALFGIAAFTVAMTAPKAQKT